jgi:prepilin-type N-terminal cleavage/methylation domain-containing protein
MTACLLHSRRGFTIPELLISIAVLLIVSAAAFPLYNNFIIASHTENIGRDFTDTLRRAHGKARASTNDARWGVHRDTASFTLFQGSSWAARNPAYDEVHIIPSSISFSGPTDYIFNTFGTTTTTGTTSITASGRAITIVVNQEGVVSIQ